MVDEDGQQQGQEKKASSKELQKNCFICGGIQKKLIQKFKSYTTVAETFFSLLVLFIAVYFTIKRSIGLLNHLNANGRQRASPFCLLLLEMEKFMCCTINSVTT